jgi:hypothetical protein
MQTQLTTITQHQVGLTFADESEARAFLVDAAPAQDAVRAQLQAVHADGADGTLHDVIGMPKKPRKAAKKVGGAKRKMLSTARIISKGRTFHCGECDSSFTSAGFLARHERQVHTRPDPSLGDN